MALLLQPMIEFRGMIGWRSRVVAIQMGLGHSKNILVSGHLGRIPKF